MPRPGGRRERRLGSAVSRELVARGARLTLSGRSGERLTALADELGSAVVGAVPGDLIEPGLPAAAGRTGPGRFRWADRGGLRGRRALPSATSSSSMTTCWTELMLVNLLAPIRLIRAAAAVLPAGGFWRVISAVVAETPTKGMAAYSAAKAGLTAFDKAAGAELRRRQIRVLDIRPTHTETGLADRPIAGTSPETADREYRAAGCAEGSCAAIADGGTGCPGQRLRLINAHPRQCGRTRNRGKASRPAVHKG